MIQYLESIAEKFWTQIERMKTEKKLNYDVGFMRLGQCSLDL